MTFPLAFLFASDDRHDASESCEPAYRPPYQSLSPGKVSAEAEQVVRIRAGDQAAFEALYYEHFDALHAFASQFVDRDSAQDVVHDVFIAVWRGRDNWHPRDSVRAYLFGATRNRALSMVRHDVVVRRTMAEGSVARAEAVPPGMGTAPEEADAVILASDARARLRAVVDRLPERQRTALLLWWQKELPLNEIAQILGVSSAAIHKLLAKAQAAVAGTSSRI